METSSYIQYNKTSYDSIAKQYMHSHINKKTEYLEDLFKGLPLDMTILDIGCGPGNNIPLLLRIKPKKVVCIDNSKEMINIAREQYPHPNIEFILSDYMNYESKIKFDFIFSHLSFVHLPPSNLKDMLVLCKNNLNKNSYLFANYFLGDKNTFKLIELEYNKNESRYFGIYTKEYVDDCYKETGFEMENSNIYKGSHFTRYNILAKTS